MTEKKRERIWMYVALAHLGLVSVGAASLPPEGLPILGPIVAPVTNYYGQMSGSSSNYAFFTPGIYGHLRALYDVVDAKGNKTTEVFRAGTTRESDLRMNDVVDQFVNDFDDPMRFQRSLAASLAGSIFASHPGAQKVNVRIEKLDAISRDEYVQEKTMSFHPVYSANFIHKTVARNK